MHLASHLLDALSWLPVVIGGFSLFGSSGDKSTSSSTTNVTNDTTTTTTDSNNITNNSTLNAVLTKNESFIKNDSQVQNTALQLTDAFNRFTNYNLANVGNTNINVPQGGSVTDYAAFFKSVPNATMNKTDPSTLGGPLLDFNTLSGLNTAQLKAIQGLNTSIQDGFARTAQVAGGTINGLAQTTSGAATASAGMSAVTKIVLGLCAVLALFLILKRK